MKLDFLPTLEGWNDLLASAQALPAAQQIPALRSLSAADLTYPQLGKLDRALTRALKDEAAAKALPQLRLAILGSSTTSHLPAGIRVASLRRGLLVEICEADYGMYQQELMDTTSALHTFHPDVVLLALDARHLAGAPGATTAAALQILEHCWTLAHQHLHCVVLQQTLLPVFPPLLGNNEQRLPTSPAAIVDEINTQLRERAKHSGIHLLALDHFSRRDGLATWHDTALWNKSKHEVHPAATQVYGDQVARLLAALRGLSSKCLVLDLDNTLWGGVIGDDGLEGIVLGEGSALGEAHLSFQRYCRALGARGVILAVCSKNDESNARAPFQNHPEMLLKESDIACFVANWDDKAGNLRRIAQQLNIGIDALVFADDNPAERALIRQELPQVQVPELSTDPATYADTLANAGYFESLEITAEDRERSRQYQANAERARLQDHVTDMESYLRSLDMHCTLRPFDDLGLARITQLINKTNQFNLTTRRYTEAEVRDAMNDPNTITAQVRLTDRFGDNGTIAILIARTADANTTMQTAANASAHLAGASTAHIDTWLMSCRVLGRRVEEACLNALAAACRARGLHRLTGTYKPTAKNGMVRDLLPRLGFTQTDPPTSTTATEGEAHYQLDLDHFQPSSVTMVLDDQLDPAIPAQEPIHAAA